MNTVHRDNEPDNSLVHMNQITVQLIRTAMQNRWTTGPALTTAGTKVMHHLCVKNPNWK